MGPIFLLDLASQKSRWLGLRQSAIATNVANASTPGFRALDVKPFDDVLARTALEMARTDQGHMKLDGADSRSRMTRQEESWETTLSGNSVNLEEQLMKAGEVTRNFALNTGLVKSFHRMILSAAKG